MKKAPKINDLHVFINCPFDTKYKPIFDASIFAIHNLGFQARHAIIDDTTAVRLTRIANEIAGSRYSIHDISSVEKSGALKLPRFNMPFEAGLAYFAHEFAIKGREHHLLLLDSVPYRYQASLSDAAGLDIKIHENSPDKVIGNIRDFLSRKSKITGLPGADYICDRYKLFISTLPAVAKAKHITMTELRSLDYLNDYQAMMVAWLRLNPP